MTAIAGEVFAAYASTSQPSVITGVWVAHLEATVDDNGIPFFNQYAVPANSQGNGNGSFIVGSYAPKTSLSGSLEETTSTITFSGLYDTTFDQSPDLTQLQGQYSGTVTTSEWTEPLTLSIDSAGNVSGQTSTGCQIQGVAKPDSAGNFFDLGVNFDTSAACAGVNAQQAPSGIAYLDSSGSSLQAIMEGPSSILNSTGGRHATVILVTK